MFDWTIFVVLVSGGDLIASEGQLASPLFPRPYPHNAHSVWTIIVPIGKKVRIEFTEIDIETGSSCAYDYLQVNYITYKCTCR